MSARLSTGLPRACSGDMYAAVPRMRPAAVPVCARVGDCERSPLDRPPGPSPAHALARPKSRTLTVPSGVTLMFAGFRSRWTMPLVRCLEPFRDLLRDQGRLVDGNRSPLQALAEVLAIDELHGQEVQGRAVGERGALEAIDVGDAGVVEGGQQLRLTLEPCEPIGITRHLGGQHLDRHLAAEIRVGGSIHLPHPAGADLGGDLVGTEAGADHRVAHRPPGGARRASSLVQPVTISIRRGRLEPEWSRPGRARRRA